MPFSSAMHTGWVCLAKLLGWNWNEALDSSIQVCRAQYARRIPSNQASLIGVGNGSDMLSLAVELTSVCRHHHRHRHRVDLPAGEPH